MAEFFATPASVGRPGVTLERSRLIDKGRGKTGMGFRRVKSAKRLYIPDWASALVHARAALRCHAHCLVSKKPCGQPAMRGRRCLPASRRQGWRSQRREERRLSLPGAIQSTFLAQNVLPSPTLVPSSPMTTAPACRPPRLAAISAQRGRSSGGCQFDMEAPGKWQVIPAMVDALSRSRGYLA
jgi:hypothetical protein